MARREDYNRPPETILATYAENILRSASEATPMDLTSFGECLKNMEDQLFKTPAGKFLIQVPKDTPEWMRERLRNMGCELYNAPIAPIPEGQRRTIPWMGKLTGPGVFGAPPVKVEIPPDMMRVYFTHRPGEKRDEE